MQFLTYKQFKYIFKRNIKIGKTYILDDFLTIYEKPDILSDSVSLKGREMKNDGVVKVFSKMDNFYEINFSNNRTRPNFYIYNTDIEARPLVLSIPFFLISFIPLSLFNGCKYLYNKIKNYEKYNKTDTRK